LFDEAASDGLSKTYSHDLGKQLLAEFPPDLGKSKPIASATAIKDVIIELKTQDGAIMKASKITIAKECLTEIDRLCISTLLSLKPTAASSLSFISGVDLQLPTSSNHGKIMDVLLSMRSVVSSLRNVFRIPDTDRDHRIKDTLP
jgi:hypothetical protein